MLEPQLAKEPRLLRLDFWRSKLVALGRGDHARLFERGVTAELVIERGDRFARGAGITGRSGTEKTPEELIETPVLPFEERRE